MGTQPKDLRVQKSNKQSGQQNKQRGSKLDNKGNDNGMAYHFGDGKLDFKTDTEVTILV
jgi:hypothetical protein